jgi:uncharacterized protein (TIGR03000 family)
LAARRAGPRAEGAYNAHQRARPAVGRRRPGLPNSRQKLHPQLFEEVTTMSRTVLKALLAVAIVVGLSQTAGAFGHRGCWGGGCGWGGGWGCGWGGCYAGYGYGAWGYGWSSGGLRYGGYYGQSVRRPAAAPVASQPPAADSTSGLLAVTVPADAKIFVNDHATTSTGTSRQYVSRAMQPGASYTYRVRAEFVRDGRSVTQEQTVQLVAGQTRALDFGDAAATASNVATRR